MTVPVASVEMAPLRINFSEVWPVNSVMLPTVVETGPLMLRSPTSDWSLMSPDVVVAEYTFMAVVAELARLMLPLTESAVSDPARMLFPPSMPVPAARFKAFVPALMVVEPTVSRLPAVMAIGLFFEVTGFVMDTLPPPVSVIFVPVELRLAIPPVMTRSEREPDV